MKIVTHDTRIYWLIRGEDTDDKGAFRIYSVFNCNENNK